MTTEHTIVSQDEWTAARKGLMAAEKELTRLRDRVSEQRRALPWVAIDKEYAFEGPDGTLSLADLFDGRSQLIVQHFMYGPEWQEGCPSCSFWADNWDPTVVHLNHRGVSVVAVSRAPLAQLEAYKKRMGWGFLWVSSLGNDFNFDYNVSFTPEEIESGGGTYNFRDGAGRGEEMPGFSVFFKDDDDRIFRTYSVYARGLDPLNSAYQYLDLVPKGRDEGGLPWPMAWLKRHDAYED